MTKLEIIYSVIQTLYEAIDALMIEAPKYTATYQIDQRHIALGRALNEFGAKLADCRDGVEAQR